ncbi:MAG: low affinity iron permease family protein [Pseudomonadota bacterium]
MAAKKKPTKKQTDQKSSGRDDFFENFARITSDLTGSAWAFLVALGVIIIWGVSGPLFGYSDTWQLVINTGTTIITFLMVFIIQHTQNKDTRALQLKLDELIRTTEGAHNAFLDLEGLSDVELCKIQERYRELAEQSRKDLRAGKKDTHKPDLKTENFDIAR